MPLRRFYRRSRRVRRWVRRRKHGVTYAIARVALSLPRTVSLGRALALADRIGDLTYFAMGRTRRLALEHIEIALGPSVSARTREKIVRAAFRNVARSFCEVAKLDQLRPRIAEYVQVEGWEHLEEVLAEGNGGIAVTGHIG